MAPVRNRKSKQPVKPRAKRSSRRRKRPLNERMGMMSISAPVAMGVVSSGISGPSVSRVEGPTCELLMSINVPKDTVSGTVIASYLLSPALMPSSRLRALSALYAQYCFRKLWVEILPAVSTSADGSIAYAIDKNFDLQLVSASTANLSYAMGVMPSKTLPMWEPTRLEADCRVSSTRQRMFLCDPDGDYSDTVQFRMLIVSAVPNTTPTSGAGILIKLGYMVEFSQPLNSINLVPSQSLLTINAGVPLGIDTASGVLTLTSSGNIVSSGYSPFFAGVPNGTIYACNPQITINIASGFPPVGFVVVCTTSTGTQPNAYCYADLEAVRAINTTNSGIGSVQGLANNVLTGSTNTTTNTSVVIAPINLIPVGKCAQGYHSILS